MKRIIVGLTVLLLIPASALAGSYNYLSADAVREKIVGGQRMILIDIQVENEYAAHHLPGALATYAYPVKSEADRKRLAAALSMIRSCNDPVVIVCPRGGGGARRAYDYLKGRKIAEARLRILENGQQGWPYAEMIEKGL